jgi:glutathione S-transferase
MSELLIHSVPGSPFGRAVLIALEEKGARYRFVAVMPGTLRSPRHLARHPFGRVPIIEHGGFRLFETQAILRYSWASTRTKPRSRLQCRTSRRDRVWPAWSVLLLFASRRSALN